MDDKAVLWKEWEQTIIQQGKLESKTRTASKTSYHYIESQGVMSNNTCT